VETQTVKVTKRPPTRPLRWPAVLPGPTFLAIHRLEYSRMRGYKCLVETAQTRFY
jgi:hypothetical protein